MSVVQAWGSSRRLRLKVKVPGNFLNMAGNELRAQNSANKILEKRWELRPQHPLALRLSVALRRGPKSWGGCGGKLFPRAFELFEICRTFGTLPGNADIGHGLCR
jgi:hypothetical protein